jgi:hypothetical protein
MCVWLACVVGHSVTCLNALIFLDNMAYLGKWRSRRVFIALHSRQSVIKAHVLLVIQYASSFQVGAFWSVIWSVMADVVAAAARSANTPPAIAI